MGRVLPRFEYHEPTSIAEAVDLASEPGTRFLAGGCDLLLALKRREIRANRLVSVLRIPELGRFLAHPKVGIDVGAAVKISELANHIWIAKRWAALHEAIEQLQPPHIRNMGTLVGNVCSAVAHADIPSALMALGAHVVSTDGTGMRRTPLEEFYVGPGRTALGDRLASGIDVPPPAPNAGSAFRKIHKAPRREGDLHKVNAAAAVTLDEAKETVLSARVVVGCCSYAPFRVPAAEARIVGAPATTETYAAAADLAVRQLKPMTDAPWVEEVRAEFVRVLVRDAIEQAASRARSKHDHFEHADDIYMRQ